MDVTQSPASTALRDLVGAYYVEAAFYDTLRGVLIRDQGNELDAVRIRHLRGEISEDDAFVWLDVGRQRLALLMLQRSVGENPDIDAVRRRTR